MPLKSCRRRSVSRYVWAAPATILGLTVAAVALLWGARIARVDGVLEAGGGLLGRFMARCTDVEAFTLGHVVIGKDAATLARWRSHEHAHVAQYERWGPLMLPLYFASSALEHGRGRHVYCHNAFEREARIVARRGHASLLAWRRGAVTPAAPCNAPATFPGPVRCP